MLLTNALGRRLASWDGVCGEMKLHKVMVAANRVGFTCSKRGDEVSLRVLTLRPGARPRVVRDEPRSMVGWSHDERSILAWDNAVKQRGVIHAIDPDTGAITGRYCCSGVALPGPAGTIIGLEYLQSETRISALRLDASVSLLAVVRGFVGEIDHLEGTTRYVMGLRPRRDDYSSYKLVELDVGTTAHHLIARFEGHHRLHHSIGAGSIVHQVADGCVRRAGQSWPSPAGCEDNWMFITPYQVGWDGGITSLGGESSVAGYWLRADGAVYVREFALDETVLTSYLRTPDGRTLRFSETPGAGEPYWVRIDWATP